MTDKTIILKPGKEKAVRNRHHWIFSGAVQQYPTFSDGDILTVRSSSGDLLGSAYFNRKSGIVGRMVAFDNTPPLEAIQNSLDAALAMRGVLFNNPKITNAYRLVNGEGDRLPGLIVDKYADILVIQLGTLGLERLRPWIIDYFIRKLNPSCIYEKSLLPSRKEEGLAQTQGVLYGTLPQEIVILENGLQFKVSVATGQKTGFFLDQRDMRLLIKTLSSGKNVLNCFAYTGGFSVYALAGGATKVDNVDISEEAILFARQNMKLNGFSESKCGFFSNDVFQFLRERDLNYDIVILDPPAFAKRQTDVVSACRGYKDINRIAMQKMPARSLLLTSSCSYHVNEELFQKVIFQAAVEAGRTVRIIGRHRMSPDHPINICHPESDYLKSLLLYIE